MMYVTCMYVPCTNKNTVEVEDRREPKNLNLRTLKSVMCYEIYEYELKVKVKLTSHEGLQDPWLLTRMYVVRV